MRTHRRFNLAVLLLGSAMAATGCMPPPGQSPSPAATQSLAPSPQQSSSPITPTNTRIPGCGLSQLTITISDEGRQEGGLGHTSTVLLLRNTGTTRCWLNGYPKVVALDSRENVVTEARQTLNGYMGGAKGSKPTTVDLAPGQTSSALFEALIVNADGTACQPYAALRVTPPGETGWITIRWNLAGCAEPEIHPIVPGASGRG